MDKQTLLKLWLYNLEFRKQLRALNYRLKYGRYEGCTLKELFETKAGIAYIKFLKNHTQNQHFKQIIIRATLAQLRIAS